MGSSSVFAGASQEEGRWSNRHSCTTMPSVNHNLLELAGKGEHHREISSAS